MTYDVGNPGPGLGQEKLQRNITERKVIPVLILICLKALNISPVEIQVE
jgi:hypothetical protein